MADEITAIDLITRQIERRQDRLSAIRGSNLLRKFSDVRHALDRIEKELENLNGYSNLRSAVDSVSYDLEEAATLAREILELKRAVSVLERHQDEAYMARAFEVWSNTTVNAYAKVFTNKEEAIDILDKSRRYWPDDEFVILIYEDGQLIATEE